MKEKFLNKKADLEKEVALRNQKIQQAENKLKQREMVLSQRQEEIQRKKMEAEAVKENLETQLVIVDKKKEELDKLQQQEIDKLEAISGLSAEEAKERLVESLKEEAKTQAQSFINDEMMMTALDAGADDFSVDGNVYEVLTSPENFNTVRDALEAKGYSFVRSEIDRIPNMTVDLDDEAAEKIIRMLDLFEDNDDVQNVYHNANLPESEDDDE